jgi:hypothetical protein
MVAFATSMAVVLTIILTKKSLCCANQIIIQAEFPGSSVVRRGTWMETLQSLFAIATETIFTFSAGLVQAFALFPFRPYNSVVRTSRLLRAHHISSVALLAFSFLVLALSLGGKGDQILSFSGGFGDGLRNIWQIDRKQIEFLYVALFVLGATTFAVISATVFANLLAITRHDRYVFNDVYHIFVAFIIMWFVLLAIISAHIFDLLGATAWLKTLTPRIALGNILKILGISDVSELIVSPALFLIFILSGYFGYRMLLRWSLRRNILNLVKGKDAQRALSRIIVMPCTALVALILILVPALYLGLLSATLFKRAAPPGTDFEYLTSCYGAGNKLHVSMIVKNNRTKSVPLTPVFIDFKTNEKALRIDHGDIFWMSKRGFYLDPGEIRHYRMEITSPQQASAASTCTAQADEPKKGFVSVKAGGDAHTLTASSQETK